MIFAIVSFRARYFRALVPLWGQTTRNCSPRSPKRVYMLLRGTIVNRTMVDIKTSIFNYFNQQYLVLLTMAPRNTVLLILLYGHVLEHRFFVFSFRHPPGESFTGVCMSRAVSSFLWLVYSRGIPSLIRRSTYIPKQRAEYRHENKPRQAVEWNIS